MPPQFYTQASLVAPGHEYALYRGMCVAFLVLQSLALLFVGVVFGAILFGKWRFPDTSSFPLFDVKYRTKVVRGRDSEQELAGVNVARVVEVMRDAVLVSARRKQRVRTV